MLYTIPPVSQNMWDIMSTGELVVLPLQQDLNKMVSSRFQSNLRYVVFIHNSVWLPTHAYKMRGSLSHANAVSKIFKLIVHIRAFLFKKLKCSKWSQNQHTAEHQCSFFWPDFSSRHNTQRRLWAPWEYTHNNRFFTHSNFPHWIIVKANSFSNRNGISQ